MLNAVPPETGCKLYKERRDAACTTLRESRNADYAALLAGQRDDRAELTARQAVGENALAGMRYYAANQNVRETYSPAAVDMSLAFRATAEEVARPASMAAEANADRSTSEDWSGGPAAANPGMRDGADIAAGLGLGMMGGAATLVERLFDGFLDSGPTQAAPANDRGSRPEPAPKPFAGVATEARRSAERAQEESARDDCGTSAGPGPGTEEGSAPMGTPGSRRRLRPSVRRLTVAGAVRLAADRSREAETLQRFALRLAMLECTLPPTQRHAARAALLLEQVHALAAVLALARAERQAAAAVTMRRRAALGYPTITRFSVPRRRRRWPRRRRHRWIRLTPSPQFGG